MFLFLEQDEIRILMAIGGLILVVFSSQAFCQILEIHHINVALGDSTLIVGPNGTTILIDAGNSGYLSLLIIITTRPEATLHLTERT